MQIETDETIETGQSVTGVDAQTAITVLKEHLTETKTELKDAKARETELLSLLKTEQEKTKLLMLSGSVKRPPKFSF
ncbi:MAG: hypothetical protein OXU23_03770 [Candidatus Poribacteria bacterium]|nr:hypothetical protein [Candidatus Poribacteria bacterium]